MELWLLCGLMCSVLAVASAEFQSFPHEPVGLRRAMEELPQVLSREEALKAKICCQADVKQFWGDKVPAPVAAWDAQLHKNELIPSENALMALSSPKEKSILCSCLQWDLPWPSLCALSSSRCVQGWKTRLDLPWKRLCPSGWFGWENQGWIEKPDKKSEYNNWSIFRPKCLGKPFLKSGIICLLESAIKVITFSIISYLFPIVQISHIAPICRVVSPIQSKKNMQNIFWLWRRVEMMLK